MSVSVFNIGPEPVQVTQKANRDQTTLVNQGLYVVYLSDRPSKTPSTLTLEPGYGITVNSGVELWACVWENDTFTNVAIAEGVGPIFAAGSI